MRPMFEQTIRAMACGVLLAASTVTAQAQSAAATPAQAAGSGQATAPQAAPQGQAVTPAKARLEQLAWIAGAWTGKLGERTIEQHWSAPAAGTIVAMYRSILGDRTTLYELLAMEQQGDTVALRIKHFAPGPGLVSQEAKDQSNDHTLISVDGKTAVFQGGTAESPVQVRFHSPEADALDITVTRQRNGAPASTEFKYRRIKP